MILIAAAKLPSLLPRSQQKLQDAKFCKINIFLKIPLAVVLLGNFDITMIHVILKAAVKLNNLFLMAESEDSSESYKM